MKRVALAAALVLAACSHVGEQHDVPVAPPAPAPAPALGVPVTMRVTVAPGGKLELALVGDGQDAVHAQVPDHPSAADLAPVTAHVPRGRPLIIAAQEDVPQPVLVALLDGLRASGITQFAVSR